jgi:hypothetical protein
MDAMRRRSEELWREYESKHFELKKFTVPKWTDAQLDPLSIEGLEKARKMLLGDFDEQL